MKLKNGIEFRTKMGSGSHSGTAGPGTSNSADSVVVVVAGVVWKKDGNSSYGHGPASTIQSIFHLKTLNCSF